MWRDGVRGPSDQPGRADRVATAIPAQQPECFGGALGYCGAREHALNKNHEYFMDRALKQAYATVEQGGRPTWVLVVKNGTIVGQGTNTVVADNDPSAHAEVNAIRDACSKLQTLDLSGCTLYSTMEPCPMCFSVIILEAKIKHLVLGARHARE